MSVTLDLVKDPVTTVEAAAILQVTVSAVQKAIKRGKLTAEQRGRDNWIEREEVEQFARERKLSGPRRTRPTRPATAPPSPE